MAPRRPQPGHELSGLGLNGARLIWQDGASIEYMDTTDGDVLLLGPGAGMRVTWDPAVSDRYAVWFEAERQVSVAARLVVYDTVTGRRWSTATSAPCAPTLRSPAPSPSGARRSSWAGRDPGLVGGGRAGEQLIPIADGDGAPVVSGGLVVWAQMDRAVPGQEIASGSNGRSPPR